MYSKIRLSILASASLCFSVAKVDHSKTYCESKSMNEAFVFIKPHANTLATQNLVSSTLKQHKVQIVAEGEISGEEIDQNMLIDQHYYAIASKATLLKPRDLLVPTKKFEDCFGLPWEDALSQGLVFNALDACKLLSIDAETLDAAWAPAKKVKFGGGFYCGLVEIPGKMPVYVFNGFFMSMRSKFVRPGTSIHYYVVKFDPASLPWSEFRGKVLGPTDPADGPEGSLRRSILVNWSQLGLREIPNVGDNGVHASASPFEGLAERMNWLKSMPEHDTFGSQAIKAGIPIETIKDWSLDPVVKGKSLFDQLEDTNSDECISRMVKLNKK